MAKDVPVGYVDFVLNITRSGDPEPFAVTFGGKVASGPFDEPATIAVAAAAQQELAELLLTGDTMTKLTAYVANDGPPLIYEADINVAGDWTGNPLPSNCAVVVTKLSGLGGRWNKGRCFWPSINEQNVDANGVIVGSLRDAYTQRFNAFLDLVTDTNEPLHLDHLCIFHDESLGILPTPITEFRAESKIGTQRRRMRR